MRNPEIFESICEGDNITGIAIKEIRGGLLVDIGVGAFLPRSQVDVVRPASLANFIGQKLECVVLKVDESRQNIVLSRRRRIEESNSDQEAGLRN